MPKQQKQPKLKKDGTIDGRSANCPPHISKARQRLSELLQKGKKALGDENDDDPEQDIDSDQPTTEPEYTEAETVSESDHKPKKRSKPINIPKSRNYKTSSRRPKTPTPPSDSEDGSEIDTDDEVIIMKKRGKGKGKEPKQNSKYTMLENKLKDLENQYAIANQEKQLALETVKKAQDNIQLQRRMMLKF